MYKNALVTAGIEDADIIVAGPKNISGTAALVGVFKAYQENQPFNDNHLRPCPMLENPEKLRQMVKETGAVNTDYQDMESVDHLCDKCESYAENWKPTAERLWNQKK